MKYISFGGIKQNWEEFIAINKVFFSGWHTSGKATQALENTICQYTSAKYCICVNSGSSANLLALASLGLEKGDKVLTSGCGFPATLNPILHLGLTPVLVDYELPSYNIDLNQIEEALKNNPDIKAILFAHTLGNPLDMDRLLTLSYKYGFKIIEDCCEALGSIFNHQQVGTFGDLGTFSFYPSHQINGFGMGGCVITNNEQLAIKIRSMRAWGKINKHTTFQGDHLTQYNHPIDDINYDEQFVYETCGWNMLIPDVASAYANVQMKKLDQFIKQRKNNYEKLSQELSGCPILPMQVHAKAQPSYFGYVINILEGNRDQLAKFLLEQGIKSRPFFAGNITRHTPFRHLFQEFLVADRLMKNAMFVGIWHGLNTKDMIYIGRKIREYFHV